MLVKEIADSKPFVQNEDVSVKRIEASDADYFEEVTANHPEKDIHDRLHSYLRNAYIGFGVRLNGRAIGYIWCVPNSKCNSNLRHPHLNRYRIELNEDDVYLFDFYIVEEHRGSGNAITCLKTVEHHLQLMGVTRHWGMVEAANQPARWLYVMNGHKVVHKITFWTFFSRLMFSGSRVFLKNSASDPRQPFDFRQIFPRPKN